MTIDLSNPIVIGVFISVISATILGIVYYVKTLVQLNFTDKKLSNVLSELDMLNKNHKTEIADIKKRHSKELEQSLRLTREAIDLYEKKIDKLIQDNRPRGLLSLYQSTQKNKK